MADEYPKARPQFFANKFCRLLTKSAAAQEISPEACWLLTVIVNQEDAVGYSKAITYWNDQLMPLCGFGSRKRLVTARDRAIKAGWLHYEQGAKGIAGRYWVTIPAGMNDMSPMDLQFRNGTANRFGGNETERQRGAMRNGNSAPFIPNPIPNPKEGFSPSKSKTKKFDPKAIEIPQSLVNPEFESNWKDWIDHRRQIKKPMTELATVRLLKKFADWGSSRSIAAINHTIENGWVGIREPETNGKTRNTEKSIYRELT
jgi:hypothetical protein